MAFTSIEFAVFLSVAVILYYSFPKKSRWILLLVLSYAFYLSCGIGVLSYILFTTVSTYLCGLIISRIENKCVTKEEKLKSKSKRRAVVATALVLNFGLLYFLKYWNFTLDIFKVPDGILRFNLIMPLGISFYIFQSMGYIIDVLRGKYQAQKNLFKFALFVSFFPQLTQGPIGRYNELSPQLYNGNALSADNLKEGGKLLLWGYFKKMVIADRASVVACAIVDNYNEYSGSVILFGIIFYCIQLYCDFSGGIDIARGSARFFGVRMAENFRRPFFSVSLAEFWRRWHITLGSWLKDYLFYPITLSKPFISLGKFLRKHIKGKAGKILPTSLATFIVYFVIGIWHGASWKYILFGCWNGVIITSSLLMEPYYTLLKKKLHIKDSMLWYRIISVLRTNAVIVIGRYITRASGFGAALSMLKKTVTDFSINSTFLEAVSGLGLSLNDYAVILFGVAVIFIFELFEETGIRISEKIEKLGTIPTFIFAFVSVIIFMYFGIYRGSYISSEFIYKQF